VAQESGDWKVKSGGGNAEAGLEKSSSSFVLVLILEKREGMDGRLSSAKRSRKGLGWRSSPFSP